MTELRVRRDDIATHELVDDARREPAEGEALLEVDRFALTANNITYGTFGDFLGYWKLFPAADGWGVIPAWGYARVAASRTPLLSEGAVYSGLVPMGDHLIVRPAEAPGGFTETSSHRAELAKVYNAYTEVTGAADNRLLVMRPLFGTAILLALVLAEGTADTVVLTSASSKTAYSLAHLLAASPVKTVGFTSEGHRAWVEGLGLYDTVHNYEEASALTTSGSAALVEFSGSRGVVRAVHEALGDQLERSIMVGFTHHMAEADSEPLPGPEPEIFFAPAEMEKRGADLATMAGAWASFAPLADRTLAIERVEGGAELVATYEALLTGQADPAVGYVASL